MGKVHAQIVLRLDRAAAFDEWAAKKAPEGGDAYIAEKNAVSIDGLPAI